MRVISSSRSRQVWDAISAPSSKARLTRASLAVGASSKTRLSSGTRSDIPGPQQGPRLALKNRRPGQDALELLQRLTHRDLSVQSQLADGPLVLPAPLLHHRDGLPDTAV